MSRQSKRMMQRQAAREADGKTVRSPVRAGRGVGRCRRGPRRRGGVGPADRRGPRRPLRDAGKGSIPAGRRLTPARLAREVRNELRQVVWPNSSELANYTTVVLTVLVLMIALIFVLNLAFGKAVLYLFQK